MPASSIATARWQSLASSALPCTRWTSACPSPILRRSPTSTARCSTSISRRPEPAMPSLAEIWRALHGAWRLLLLDTHGLAEFDGSRSGGLRSLWAIALVLPLNIAVIAITELGPAAEMLPPHSTAFQLVGDMLAWPLLLLVVYGLARWYGRAERYWLFVATYDWTQIPLALAGMLMVSLFIGAGSL